MKTVGIVLHPYGERHAGGLGRTCLNLTKAIVEQDSNTEFIIFTKGEKQVPAINGTNWRVVALPDTFFWLDRPLRKHADSLDVCVFFTPMMPITWTPRQAIVVVHDTGIWRLQPHRLRSRLLQLMQGHALNRAAIAVAVSYATRDDLVSLFPGLRQRIRVIYNGFDHPEVAIEESSILPQKPYFLFLGVLKERKNILGILTAYELFRSQHGGDYAMVFAGPVNPRGSFATRVSQHAYAQDIALLGAVTDNQRALLYRDAFAFLFPSFFEGFGLPILEAMYAGVPVITSRGGATEEVAGGAALLVDPRNTQSIADGMLTLVREQNIRKECVARGLARSRKFSWREAGRAYIMLMHQRDTGT